MVYDAKNKRMTVAIADMDRACASLRWALKHVRQMGGKPLDGTRATAYPMDDADYAEAGIIDAAHELGLDIGQGGDKKTRIDVRDAG